MMKKNIKHIAVMIAIIMVVTAIPMSAFGGSNTVKKGVKVPSIYFVRQIEDSVTHIVWRFVPGAKGYDVYRSTIKRGGYKKVATTRKRFLVDRGLSNGETYSYKIRAFKMTEKGKVYGKFSRMKAVTIDDYSFAAPPNSAPDLAAPPDERN